MFPNRDKGYDMARLDDMANGDGFAYQFALATLDFDDWYLTGYREAAGVS